MSVRILCGVVGLAAAWTVHARVGDAQAPPPSPSAPAPAASSTPVPTPPPPAELSGRIDLREKDGRVVAGAGAVVWVEGARPAATGPAPTITSRDKRFTPHVVAVDKGTTITFPNVDRIFHNVFSRTPGSEFDLGLYRRGARRTFRMSRPGLVRVYCNIHPEMAAFVMVLDGAAFAVAGDDGSFQVRGIPPGRRVVRVWSERGGEKEAAMVFRAGGHHRFDAQLDTSGYRPLRHKNKHGQDYPPVTRDVDRY
jgi:plastocyanin